MKWILLLTAINTFNDNDRPAHMTIEFPSLAACQASANTIQYELNFKIYKVEHKCQEKNY